MTTPISPITPISGASAISPIGSLTGASQTSGTSASPFAQALNQVSSLETDANITAQKLATGQLSDVHDFTIAAAKASTAIELTVALRDRAVEAYQDIMRMQI